MAVPEFNVKEQWIGTSLLTDYTFDFTIQDLQHLLVIVQDLTGAEYTRVRGDDTDFLAGVVFNSEKGGGTISLKGVLPNNWILTALQANDAPAQRAEFKDKFSFTLERFELALDYIITAVQRVAYLCQRSMKLHDLEDSYEFDSTLPLGVAVNPRATIVINAAGDGFDFGPTADEILAAQGFADAAAASASDAAAHEVGADNALAAAIVAENSAAASAIAAAASAASISGMVHTGPFAGIAPNTNADLETIDHTVNTEVDYIARIKRGTIVYARVEFTVFYRNSAWEIAIGEGRRADASSAHGVAFTVGVGGAINAAVANDGGSNAIIDLNKILWAL